MRSKKSRIVVGGLVPNEVWKTCDEIEYVKGIGNHKVTGQHRRNTLRGAPVPNKLQLLIAYRDLMPNRAWAKGVDVSKVKEEVDKLIAELEKPAQV